MEFVNYLDNFKNLALNNIELNNFSENDYYGSKKRISVNLVLNFY